MSANFSKSGPSWTETLQVRGADAVAGIVDEILARAIGAQATDIHFEPMAESLRVRFRLNGLLQTMADLPPRHTEQIIGRLKVLAGLLTYKTDQPQDGYIPPPKDFPRAELRVSTFPTVHGEKTVVRIFDSKRVLFDLDTLGFHGTTLAEFKELLLRAQGLVILTGPAGSGKTTTLYSALKFLQREIGDWASVSTIEDPVECQMEGICQTQIAPHAGFGYAEALRALLRQDPKIIFLGEIRDVATAQIAVQAGLTGHLVLTTMHSGSAAGVFARMLHMEIEPFLVASAVSGVVSQRLVRTVCSFCPEHDAPEPALLRFPHADKVNDKLPSKFRRGRGCEQCADTGYRGQTVLSELLTVNSTLREAILAKATTEQLAAAAAERDLWIDGYEKACAGITTLAELHRVLATE